ncbi:MAG: hypothetical protein E7254_08745 [Lachnospiraceae bacterium]|nr:hypothetical protein [Lachnospiraceae bacterium]
MENKTVKLYNAFFPFWMFFLFPVTWLIAIPANFLIDSLVLVIGMYVIKVSNKKQVYRKSIVKVVIFGFLSDFIGMGLMFLLDWLCSFSDDVMFEDISHALVFNPFENPVALIYTIGCLIVIGFFIYWFDKKVAFRKVDISELEKKKLALTMAVFTTPYIIIVPTGWFVTWY